jgi:hypothetical protein
MRKAQGTADAEEFVKTHVLGEGREVAVVEKGVKVSGTTPAMDGTPAV